MKYGYIKFDVVIEDEKHCSKDCINYSHCTDNSVQCMITKETIAESYKDKAKRTHICKEKFEYEDDYKD